MNGKHILGTVSLLLILNMVGCQGARNTGKDPLLGKTRLDPPATSARSVYIERANIHDSGVVPGNRRTLASAPVTDSENNANSINNSTPNHADPSSANLSTASGTSRVVRYPTELDGTNTENTKNTENIENTKRIKSTETLEKPVENFPNITNSSHLRWISVPQPTTQSRNTGNVEVLPNGHYLDVPTEAELRTYQYIYDFSTYPPRPRAIRKSGEVPSCNPVTSPATFVLLPDTSALGKTQSVTENSENSSNSSNTSNTSNTRIQGELNASNSVNASPTPSRYCRVQLAGKGFDPYAPNRTYERKRAALSQDMEAIFDREPNQSLISHQNPYNNIYPSSPNTMPTLSAPALSQPATAKPTIIAQNPAPTTGWQVIATPSHASTLSPQPLTVAEVAPTPASVNAAVGTQVTLPSEKKASQFPPITSETIQREIPYTTFPNSNDAINILDLPER